MYEIWYAVAFSTVSFFHRAALPIPTSSRNRKQEVSRLFTRIRVHIVQHSLFLPVLEIENKKLVVSFVHSHPRATVCNCCFWSANQTITRCCSRERCCSWPSLPQILKAARHGPHYLTAIRLSKLAKNAKKRASGYST